MPENEFNEQRILEEAPRMKLDTCFNFQCGPDKDCFNSCCRDVAILLSPYDVIRLKHALKMESTEFLEKYTLTTVSREKRVPAVLLRMDEQTRKCPLVSEKGCSVYPHRPWPCRMYPLGMAEPKGLTRDAAANRFYFLVKEDLCHGHGSAEKERTVREWIDNQGVEEFDQMQAPFLEFMSHPGFEKPDALNGEQMAMYHMALYDLDRFRRFIFETRFLELFEIDEARLEAIAKDDEDLLELALDWLAFSLFHDRRMKMKKNINVVAPAATSETKADSGSPA